MEQSFLGNKDYFSQFQSSRSRVKYQFELQRDSVREFHPKEREETSAESQTWGIGHGRREVERETSSRRGRIECALRVI
jgi:hypothetical protein